MNTGAPQKRSTSNNTCAVQIKVNSIKTPLTPLMINNNKSVTIVKKTSLTPTRDKEMKPNSSKMTTNKINGLSISENLTRQRPASNNSITVNKVKPSLNSPLRQMVNKPSPSHATQGSQKQSLLNKIERVANILSYSKANVAASARIKSPLSNKNGISNRISTGSKSSKSPKANLNLKNISTNTENVSLDKSYGSNFSNDAKSLQSKKTNESKKTPKSPSSPSKLPSKSKSPISLKLNKPKSPVNNKATISANANNIFLNKNSLLKQYEELKNRSISPIGYSNALIGKKDVKANNTSNNNHSNVTTPTSVSKKDTSSGNIKQEEKVTAKFGARNTIQVSQPEYLIKMLNSEKDNKDKDRAKNDKDFRENTTSPLLIRRKTNENENQSKSLLQAKFQENKINIGTNKPGINASITTSLVPLLTPPPLETKTKLITKPIRKIHTMSQIGYSGPDVKKINQDNYFVFKNFNDDSDSFFMSVCDGHGLYGHNVSAYLKENLPPALNAELRNKKVNLKTHNSITPNTPSVNKIIEAVFLSINSKLFNEATIDTNFSGSTCVSLIYCPDRLICANVGDSRCVLGRHVEGVWTSQDLSRDHKPDEKDEAARIKRRGGRIEPYKDENDEFIGPPRIWLKLEDIPGLAMTRSFGDQIAASVGILAEPEMKEWTFTQEDKFLILASDGVWEFIDSQECVNIVKDFYLQNDIQGACEFLIKESAKRWMTEEEVIDDTTVILVFFD